MTNARTFAFDGYASHFNESALWRKLKKVAGKVGRKAVYHVLVLYYVARDHAVPTSLKIKVFGALGYFILPLDFIPDAILGLGFTDDILALAWAVFSLRKYITPDIKAKARARVDQWFGAPQNSRPSGTNVAPWHVAPDDPRIIDVEAEEY